MLSNGSQDLDRASKAAAHALELLQTVKAPQRVSIEEWTAASSRPCARGLTKRWVWCGSSVMTWLAP